MDSFSRVSRLVKWFGLISLVAVLGCWMAFRAGPSAFAKEAKKPLSPDLEKARAALDKYQDPILAVHDGYFSTVACLAFPKAGGMGEMSYPAGGMGIHFLNPALIGTPLESTKPQVLIYEPQGDKLKLVAAEWFVPVSPDTKKAPVFFGQTFNGPMEGHHPIMPESLHHWDLHVWLWKNNPAGMFIPTNPDVKCPKKGYSIFEDAPKMVHPS